MTHGITVGHNFETGHRLPHLPGGKCASLHGHSWWARISIGVQELSADGTVIEFGELKARLRDWLDTNLDHGMMLGADDPLCGPLREHGTKLYVFDDPDPDGRHRLAQGLQWPTVEHVAVLLGRVAATLTADLDVDRPCLIRAVVRETAVNQAEWTDWV